MESHFFIETADRLLSIKQKTVLMSRILWSPGICLRKMYLRNVSMLRGAVKKVVMNELESLDKKKNVNGACFCVIAAKLAK